MRTRPSLTLLATVLIVVVAVASLTSFACSPAVNAPMVVSSSDFPPRPPKHDGPDSPSRWSLETMPSWKPRATLAIGATTLEVGDGGERWLKSNTDRSAAPTLLPADIIGVAKDPSGYLFVLVDGSVYSANDPIGPAIKVASAQPHVTSATVGKSSVLLADATGALMRSSDRGRTFAKVTLPQPDGIVRAIVMSGPVGLVLMTPQRLLVTKDDGASWTQMSSPSEDGVSDLAQVDGELRVIASSNSFTLDTSSFAFKPVSTKTSGGPSRLDEEVVETTHRVDGKHALLMTGQPFSQKREWAIAIGELATMPSPKVLDDLTGCDEVDAAMRGDIIEIACDARGSIESGVDKIAAPFDSSARFNSRRTQRASKNSPQAGDGGTPSTGFIVKLLRSEDGGKSFKEDGVLEGGGATKRGVDNLAIGDGGWVYLSPRCFGNSYDGTCGPARIRNTSAATFTDIAEEAVAPVRFASNSKVSEVYALAVGPSGVEVVRFKSGAIASDPVTEVAATMNEELSTLSLDDDSTLHGFVSANDGPHLFAIKPGASDLTTIAVPAKGTLHVAMAGNWGFAFGASNKAYETSDQGKTWVNVARPDGARRVGPCSAFGCVTDRGFRSGWDGAASAASVATEPLKNVFSKPLKCTAQGRWQKLGGGSLPSLENTDVGGARWLLPTRDADGRVTLHVNKRGDTITKTTDVTLTGPALQPPKFGAETAMFVQPNGVVVRRYTYSKERRQPGIYNPVDAQLVWYRADSGKVFRGSVSKIPPFRVQHDPKFDYEIMQAQPNGPELALLDAKGLYFMAASYEDDKPLYLVRDDGRVEKIKATMPDGDFAGIAQVGPDVGVANASGAGVSVHWVQRDKDFMWRTGREASNSLIDFGGRAAQLITTDDPRPPQVWAVPLKPELDPSEWFALPTQKALGDVPRACDAPAATDGSLFRYFAPYSVGTRHPVSIDVDGTPVILATDRLAVRGSTKTPNTACVSALEVLNDDEDTAYSGLVFADDLTHSVLFTVNKSDAWPEAISMRPMECQYIAGELPDSLKEKQGFFTGTKEPVGRIPDSTPRMHP